MNYQKIYLIAPFLLVCSIACHAENIPQRQTLLINHELTTDNYVSAPDEGDFYKAIDGSHFSYACQTKHTFNNGQAAVDLCKIRPVKLKILGWPETEVIQLIDGEVTILELDGTTKKYNSGDTFVLPRGFKGIWKQDVDITKISVRSPLYWKD